MLKHILSHLTETGNFNGTALIALSTVSSTQASIKYTLDGSMPSGEHGTAYSAPGTHGTT